MIKSYYMQLLASILMKDGKVLTPTLRFPCLLTWQQHCVGKGWVTSDVAVHPLRGSHPRNPGGVGMRLCFTVFMEEFLVLHSGLYIMLDSHIF